MGRWNNERKYGYLEGLRRLIHYRMVIPIKRSAHPPEYTARGVLVGIMWALTPTVGAQMPLVFVTWLIARRLLRWDFSVIVGMAWTWTTNVVTMVPVYYLFYITGQIMLGRGGEMTGYGEFHTLLDQAMAGAEAASDGGFIVGWFDWLVALTGAVFRGWGVPMLIGCLPWSFLGGWLAYVWSLRVVRRHREAKARRRARRAGRGGAPDSG